MGMAKFGSVLGMLGFGAEHAITSGIGIAGSLAGGALGGGLLGMGAMGVAGVGMGTDMAGMGQALGDIKNVVAAQNQLNQAIAVYGPASYQAAAAQGQLNYVLSDFPAVARGAVVAAANTVQGFKTMFDQLTGPAEKTGAQIINQVVQVAEKFLPTIGKYAAINMWIMKKDLQPLFSWLQNAGPQGGLGIFKNLESIFTGHLPTAIHMMTQAFEFFAKTMNVAAGYTGGFISVLDKFFTRMNSPAAFSKWAVEVGKLIGLFRSWLHVGVAAVGVIIDLFKPAVGFGQAFAVLLGSILDQFKGFLSLGGTQSVLHNLFSAHLEEVIKGIGGVLKNAMPLVEAFALGFMKVATVGATIASAVLKPLASLIGYLAKIPGATTAVAWGTALYFIGTSLMTIGKVGFSALSTLVNQLSLLPIRIGLIGLKLKSVGSALGNFATQMGSMVSTSLTKLAALVMGEDAAATATTGMKLAMIGLAAVGILVVAAAVYELIKHFGVIHGLLIAAAGAVGILTVALIVMDAVPVVAVVVGIVLALAGLVAGIYWVATHWSRSWHDMLAVMQSIWHTAIQLLRSIPGEIVGIFAGAGTLLYNIGSAIIGGLWNGMKAMWHTVTGWLSGLGHVISSLKGPISVDAVLLVPHGNAIMGGLYTGLQQGFLNKVEPLVSSIAGQINNTMNQAGLPQAGRPGALGTGGMGMGRTVHAVFQINAPGGNPTAIQAAIEKDSAQVFAQQVLQSMRAGSGSVY